MAGQAFARPPRRFALPSTAMLLPDAAPALACPNCGRPYAGPRPKFCPECGQETHIKPPKLSEFLQQFGGAYLSTEGALWRTLKLLLFKPGELTRQYLAGRRKHYVLPLRLYLTVSLLVLCAIRLVANVDINIKPEAAGVVERETNNITLQMGQGKAGLRDGRFFCESLPNWVCKRLQRRLDIDPKAMASEATALKERFLGNLGGALFVLLPSFALWLKLAYLNRRMRYTEHIVFALHVHALWFLALALMLTQLGPLPGIGVFAVPVYTLLALRRVYGGRWWPLLLRAGVVGLLYAVTLGFAMAGVALWSFLM